MAKICDIEWQTDPSSFLNPNTTIDLAQDFTSGSLNLKFDRIINEIKSEMDKGLSVEAFCLEGHSPLNQLSQELSLKMQSDYDQVDSIGNQIISDGNKHTSEEVNIYYEKVMEEYNKRKAVLRSAVDSYNGSRTVPKENGEKDSDGNVLTDTLPEIKLINGEDNNYQRVIISGGINSRSSFYSNVKEALANTEAIYPKPEVANRYRAMWSNLSSSSGTTKTDTEETITFSKKGWSSYDDAVAAGFSNILTPSEFARRKTEYSSYQEYLDAMYDKYVTNSFDNMKYRPEYKTGKIDTRLVLNNYFWKWDTVKYEGEYLEFTNEDGEITRVPLAIIEYDDKSDQIKYYPMTYEQKKQYINKITQYYNDIMDNSKNYTDRFRNETNDKVDSLSIIYIDPSSRNKIQATYNKYSEAGNAAYCKQTSGLSNHSNIVIFSNEFINFDDSSSNNNDEVYDYMVRCYTHELGHAYANNRMILWDRDNTYVWNNIYNTVTSDDTNRQILRDYSIAAKQELFADSTEYYYNDPDRLKQVEINIDLPEFKMHFNTLYDYMDYILN